MENFFDKESLCYYVDEFSANKYVGIVDSKRKVGKTMLGVIMMIHQISRSGLDGVFFCSKFKKGLHIFDKIIHVLTHYGVKYDIIKNRTIKFDKYKIQFKNFNEIKHFSGYDKKVVLIDDISFEPNMQDYLIQISYFAEYLVYTDLCVIDAFKNMPTYDTSITKTKLRLMKIKKLLNNER